MDTAPTDRGASSSTTYLRPTAHQSSRSSESSRAKPSSNPSSCLLLSNWTTLQPTQLRCKLLHKSRMTSRMQTSQQLCCRQPTSSLLYLKLVFLTSRTKDLLKNLVLKEQLETVLFRAWTSSLLHLFHQVHLWCKQIRLLLIRKLNKLLMPLGSL